MDQVELWFAILAIVLTVAALASGVVDRAPLSLPIVFLALGLLLGPGALDLIRISPHDPALAAIATLNLALVLFLDAARFDIEELRREWRVPLLDLGPGTLLTIAGITVVAGLLLHLSVIQSVLLGAILASTDPIVLRDVVRDERVPRSVRRTLTIEAGTNDIIVLPIVLIAIEISLASGSGIGYWLGFLARLLVLSPAVGLAVGGVGAWFMGKADERYSIRREYQALYGIGLVLVSYVTAEAVGGDGFLAAFFAGLAVALFDVTLCDCFMDYGEVTAEMAMLLAFILFGAVLGPLFGTISFGLALAFAIIAIFAVRPGAMSLALMRAKMSPIARGFIAWFGPRGLSALLLALLVVASGAPEATTLLAITGVVVLVSVLAHGISATPAARWYGQKIAQASVTLAEERESDTAGLFEGEASDISRVTPEELRAWMGESPPPIVLDVRSRAHYAEADGQIPGSVRVLPDQIREWAEQVDPAAKHRRVVAYCT
ncbi:MAG TPA: cation:proton antiporter [Ktedonobacterales bacterium]|nr:cation:proton antiporter [Ktedonobacterales bacterium]